MLSALHSDSIKFLVTLSSRVVSALVGIIFVPIYVRLIGAESYGLISFYATLSGTLSILDLGLSTAISRQVAIDIAHKKERKEIIGLVFSVEVVYWLISLLIGLLVVIGSGIIATYWVKSNGTPVITIGNSIMLMGITFMFQFPMSFYNGIMTGLQKQVANSIIIMLYSVFKAVGVIFILNYFTTSIEVYFVWQLVCTLLFTIILRVFSYSEFNFFIPLSSFSINQIKRIWRFAAGITGISIISLLLTQVDKLAVSKLVTLEFVGYYNLAFLLAGGINQLIAPIQPIIFPKFTSLIATKQHDLAIALYHKSAKWVSIVIFPIGLILFNFSYELLLFWTNNQLLTTNTSPVLKIAVLGCLFNCMMWVPYIFMLANGNTKFTIYQNIILSVLMMPLLYFLTIHYGIKGASYVWLCINTLYVVFSIPLFHYFFMKNEYLNWIKKDVIWPLVVSVLIFSLAKYAYTSYFNNTSNLYLLLILFISVVIYFVSISEFRKLIISLIKRIN